MLSINGRVRLQRRWWHDAQTGSLAPADEAMDRSGATITPGVLELACRENLSAMSFEKAAANLARTAQLTISGEQLRKEVEAVGRRVAEAQQTGRIETAWEAEDCRVTEERQGTTTRVYTGCDGVMVPVITDAEKQKRREAVKAKRRRCGKKRKPLPPRKRGADQGWKEFKVVYFYSEDMRRQHMAVTHRNHEAAGKLLRREADRLRFGRAGQRVAVVDGAVWIRDQMELHLAELDGLGLDFYHLSENVHRARRKVFGDVAPEGRAWADALEPVQYLFRDLSEYGSFSARLRKEADDGNGMPSWVVCVCGMSGWRSSGEGGPSLPQSDSQPSGRTATTLGCGTRGPTTWAWRHPAGCRNYGPASRNYSHWSR